MNIDWISQFLYMYKKLLNPFCYRYWHSQCTKSAKIYFLLQILTFSMYETLKKFMLCFWCWQFQCFIQFLRFMKGCRCWDSTATAVLIENLFEELLIVSSKICKNVPHQKVCLSLVARGQGWIFEWLVSWWYWYTCYQSG